MASVSCRGSSKTTSTSSISTTQSTSISSTLPSTSITTQTSTPTIDTANIFTTQSQTSIETSTYVTTSHSPAFSAIHTEITSIDSGLMSSLSDLLRTSDNITESETVQSITTDESLLLTSLLTDKFSSWAKHIVDNIDPSKPAAIKNFFDLQEIQALGEYESYTDMETREYVDSQMREKFNQWVRYRVDEINPQDQDSLRNFFDLQVIQQTGKYDELATDETKQYKEQQMKDKFNQWVRNRVDEIDPASIEDIKYFFWLQTIQHTEKWDRFATEETHNYKEAKIREKFNEWIKNRVDELDPNAPGFLEELEKLRNLQMSDKYDLYISAEMHSYKEQALKTKVGEYTRNMVDILNPLSANYIEDVASLLKFQSSEIYREFCPLLIKEYKEERLQELFLKPKGGNLLPPNIVGFYPDNIDGVTALDDCIFIIFDQPMNMDSIREAIEISGDTTFLAASIAEEDFIIMIRPAAFMAPDEEYIITVNNTAVSLAGIALEQIYTFIFTTETAMAAPVILETTPYNGTIDKHAGQPVAIFFDQSMYAASVEAAISISPFFEYGAYWAENNTVIYLQSFYPLEYNTEFTVTISGNAMSADGISLGTDYTFSFITAIMGLPMIMGTMPESGLISVSVDHTIQIVFDRSMDTSSIESLITISPQLEYVIEWAEADMVLKIRPVSPLNHGMTYTIKIPAGVLSSFGLPMQEVFEFSFTTD
jgi:hypothetical protein